MIFATDDMRDLHLHIVHDIDEMKHRIAVTADDHKIRVEHFGLIERTHHATGDEVGHLDWLAGHLETDRAFAFVPQTLAYKLFHPSLVDARPLRLKVGPERASLLRTLVPIQSQPPQPVENGVEGLLRIARRVRVFDAQYKCATRVTGVQPVEQRRAHAPDMEKTGGTRRKSNSEAHRGGKIADSGHVEQDAIPPPGSRVAHPRSPPGLINARL